MVIANPPLAEPVIDPGGVTIKPPFEMGVANLNPVIIPKLYGLAVWKGIFNVRKGTFQRIQLCYFFHIWNLQRMEGRNQLFF